MMLLVCYQPTYLMCNNDLTNLSGIWNHTGNPENLKLLSQKTNTQSQCEILEGKMINQNIKKNISKVLVGVTMFTGSFAFTAMTGSVRPKQPRQWQMPELIFEQDHQPATP